MPEAAPRRRRRSDRKQHSNHRKTVHACSSSIAETTRWRAERGPQHRDRADLPAGDGDRGLRARPNQISLGSSRARSARAKHDGCLALVRLSDARTTDASHPLPCYKEMRLPSSLAVGFSRWIDGMDQIAAAPLAFRAAGHGLAAAAATPWPAPARCAHMRSTSVTPLVWLGHTRAEAK
jgi:hypothetical protein